MPRRCFTEKSRKRPRLVCGSLRALTRWPLRSDADWFHRRAMFDTLLGLFAKHPPFQRSVRHVPRQQNRKTMDGHSPSGDSTAGRSQQQAMQSSGAAPRRAFLERFSFTAMVTGLVAGYGLFATHAGRFLFPNRNGTKTWHFVATLDQLPLGVALPFTTPHGVKVVVTRQAEGESAKSFSALSSVCPHLGCAVHWEPQNDQFFCPCHNGAFDATGKATKGPPLTARQELTRFPLRVEDGMLFIEISLEAVSAPSQNSSPRDSAVGGK